MLVQSSSRVVPTRVGSLTAATQIHNPSAPRWKEIDQQGMRGSGAGGTHACRMECETVMIFPKKDLWIHRWLKAIVACLISGIPGSQTRAKPEPSPNQPRAKPMPNPSQTRDCDPSEFCSVVSQRCDRCGLMCLSAIAYVGAPRWLYLHVQRFDRLIFTCNDQRLYRCPPRMYAIELHK